MSEMTVLVVDDEEDLLEIFSVWLTLSGYRVLSAPNGAEALKFIATEKIDALISDIRMPIMDGPSLVRRIRDMGVVIPAIIFVSGFGDIDLREMHALGVEAMIEKPLHRKTLLAALADSLRDRSELWSTPIATTPHHVIAVDLASPDQTSRRTAFQVGRGGCCFPSNGVVAKGQLIDLTILLPDNPTPLKVQGEVRWYDRDTGIVGIAFRYLDPLSRSWILDSIQASKPGSFIPSGRDG